MKIKIKKKLKLKSKSGKRNNKKVLLSSPTQDKLRYVRLNGKIIDTHDKKFREEVKREHDKSDHFQDKAEVMASDVTKALGKYIIDSLKSNQERESSGLKLQSEMEAENKVPDNIQPSRNAGREYPPPELLDEIYKKFLMKDGEFDWKEALKFAYKKGLQDFIKRDIEADEKVYDFAYKKAIDDVIKRIAILPDEKYIYFKEMFEKLKEKSK